MKKQQFDLDSFIRHDTGVTKKKTATQQVKRTHNKKPPNTTQMERRRWEPSNPEFIKELYDKKEINRDYALYLLETIFDYYPEKYIQTKEINPYILQHSDKPWFVHKLGELLRTLTIYLEISPKNEKTYNFIKDIIISHTWSRLRHFCFFSICDLYTEKARKLFLKLFLDDRHLLESLRRYATLTELRKLSDFVEDPVLKLFFQERDLLTKQERFELRVIETTEKKNKYFILKEDVNEILIMPYNIVITKVKEDSDKKYKFNYENLDINSEEAIYLEIRKNKRFTLKYCVVASQVCKDLVFKLNKNYALNSIDYVFFYIVSENKDPLDKRFNNRFFFLCVEKINLAVGFSVFRSICDVNENKEVRNY